MSGICTNYYKKEKINEKNEFEKQELKFIKSSRLVRLLDLEVKNLSNMMYENIIDKNSIINTLQEMAMINKVLIEKLENKNL